MMNWLNYLSILMMSFEMVPSMPAAPAPVHPPLLQYEENWRMQHEPLLEVRDSSIAQGRYLVVERLDESTAVLEIEGEYLELPRKIVPEIAQFEGAVLEWHYAPVEAQRRLQDGYARLARLTR